MPIWEMKYEAVKKHKLSDESVKILTRERERERD